MKIKVIILTLLIILSFSVLAEPADIDAAYAWLLPQQNTDVFQASLTALAISRADSSRTQPYLDFIKNNKHPTEACWPSPNCNVKDTSSALLVETKLGLGLTDTSTQDITSWLASKQILAPLTGTWNLQIITPNTGQCSLKYQKQGETFSNEFTLEINQGKISYGSCQDQYFFNLNSCLGTNIINKPSTLIEVSCQSLTSSSISIIYIEGNSIYLINTPLSTRAQILINNGFFNNKLDTLYANWALNEANSNVNSLIYLKKNQENKVIDQSLLYIITKEESFLDNLITLQSNFGQFKDQSGSVNEFDNGLAGLALQENNQRASELEFLRDYLGSVQRQDGSWSSISKTTAMILYGTYQGGNLPQVLTQECGNNIKEGNEECDGSDWGTITDCIDLGFIDGPLSCTTTCIFDASSCIGEQITECNDGIDNDNDGFCDLLTSVCTDNSIPGDSDCTDASDNSEASITPQAECTLSNPKWLNQNGVETSTARGFQSGKPEGDTVLASIEGNTECRDKQIVFDIYEDELGEDVLQTSLDPVLFNIQEGFVFREFQPPWFDDDPLPQVEGDPEFYFIAKTIDSTTQALNSSLLQVTKPTTTQCSDGIDNDNNDLIDLEDPGCVDINDLVEDQTALACADGIDNDNDGLIDSVDPGCTEPFNQDNSEVDGECIPDWTCDPFSICSTAGTQTRLCRDLNACGEECPENDETCITERDCPIGEEEPPIDLPDTGEDTDGDEEEPSISANPCSVNDICEPEWGEDEFNCPEDCLPQEPGVTPPIDGFPPTEPPEEPPFEEPEEKSSFWIYVIIILLILVLIGAYFFVFKKPAKKGGIKEFGLPSQPSRPSLFGPEKTPSKTIIPKKEKKTKVEENLEKSLKEAKRLLGR